VKSLQSAKPKQKQLEPAAAKAEIALNDSEFGKY
jgi:hypothetical protein